MVLFDIVTCQLPNRSLLRKQLDLMELLGRPIGAQLYYIQNIKQVSILYNQLATSGNSLLHALTEFQRYLLKDNMQFIGAKV